MNKFSLSSLNSLENPDQSCIGTFGANRSLKKVKLTSEDNATQNSNQNLEYKVRIQNSFKSSFDETDKAALLSNLSSDSKALLSKYIKLKPSSSFQSDVKQTEQKKSQMENYKQENSSRDVIKQAKSDIIDTKVVNIKFSTPESKKKRTYEDFIKEDRNNEIMQETPSLNTTNPRLSKMRLMNQEQTLKKKVSSKSKIIKETEILERDSQNHIENRKLFQNLMTQSKLVSQLKKPETIESQIQDIKRPSQLLVGNLSSNTAVKQLTGLSATTDLMKPKLQENLVSVKDFKLQDLFPFEFFNAFQSQCFDTIWNSSHNVIVSAPTGSGKTVLFELAIAKYISQTNFQAPFLFKAIYIAPIKALCQQKYSEWKRKFIKFNLSLLELTGDADFTDFSQYETAHIIVTTPEKWDSVTRRWKDNSRMVSNISLIMIDEVHLLNTEERGATLEAVVSRMKIISKSEDFAKSPNSNIRIIAISATIPNINDLAKWLEVGPECIKNFGDEYRSTPIEKHVFGYVLPRNEFQFEKSLNYKLAEIIRKFSSGKPTLIFCQTQKGTISACEQIMTDMNANELVRGDAQLKKLLEISKKVLDKNLQKFLPHGIAFHNAGMSYDDRRIIEDLFINGFVQIICTTTTLAMGVNLPARLVIIKSTLCYRGPGVGYTEYSPLEIDQMIGRAGRPQFDTHGVVVIMTERSQIEKYRKQTLEKEPLESHFSEQLAEHINAEISLRSIRSLETVVKYLKGTFFYVRMQKNPSKYGINKQTVSNPKMIDEYLMSVSKKVVRELSQYEMIHYSPQDGTVRPLELGIDMSRYYISFATMKRMFENQSKQDLKSLIGTLSEAQEFEKIRSKLEERKILSNMNTFIKFPCPGAISTPSRKACVLLQCGIGNLSLEDWELKRQLNDIMGTSLRIMQCFKRLFLIKRYGQGLANCLRMIKYISMRTWEDNNMTILKQLAGIGDKLATTLCEAHLESFEKILNTPPHILEMTCNKNPPFGVQLHKKIKLIPRVSLEIFDINANGFKAKITLQKQDQMFPLERWEPRCGYHFIVQDKGNIAHFIKYIPIDEEMTNGITFSINGIKSIMYPLSVSLINEKYVGIDLKYLVHANGNSCKFSGEYGSPEETDETPNEKQTPKGKEQDKTEEAKLNLYNMTMRCSHKCKDKKKCKHPCCKIGSISPIKTQKSGRKEDKIRLEGSLDIIDENIEYIDELLAGRTDEKQAISEIKEEKEPDTQKRNCKQKGTQQSNILNYMTAKKGKVESILEKIKATKAEGRLLFNMFPHSLLKVNEYVAVAPHEEETRNILEKYGVVPGENSTPTLQNIIKSKSEPQEQFYKLFGNIFD